MCSHGGGYGPRRWAGNTVIPAIADSGSTRAAPATAAQGTRHKAGRYRYAALLSLPGWSNDPWILCYSFLLSFGVQQTHA